MVKFEVLSKIKGERNKIYGYILDITVNEEIIRLTSFTGLAFAVTKNQMIQLVSKGYVKGASLNKSTMQISINYKTSDTRIEDVITRIGAYNNSGLNLLNRSTNNAVCSIKENMQQDYADTKKGKAEAIETAKDVASLFQGFYGSK